MQEKKTTYDNFAKHFSQTRNHSWPEFETFLGYLPKGNQNILDVGCGNGRLSESLPKTYLYTGIDESKQLIQLAQEKYPQKTFHTGKMQSLPFENQSFDIIFAIASFQHLLNKKDRIKTLNEFLRVLKPGGFICMSNWALHLSPKRKSPLKILFDLVLSKEKLGPQDYIIPFKTSQKEVIGTRYYRNLQESELRSLTKNLPLSWEDSFFSPQLSIKKSNRNFCVVLKKVEK